MENGQSPEVLAFRIERMKKAPRNWCYWIGIFTTINGILLISKSDVLFLAGLVIPYQFPSPLPHFIAAVIYGLVGYLWKYWPLCAKIALGVYFVDLLLCAVLGFWAGVAMHAAIFFFIFMAHVGSIAINKQLEGSPRGEGQG